MATASGPISRRADSRRCGRSVVPIDRTTCPRRSRPGMVRALDLPTVGGKGAGPDGNGFGPGAGRSSHSVRTTASIVLAVIGGVLALIGAVLLYARTDIIDQDRFAEHASEALAGRRGARGRRHRDRRPAGRARLGRPRRSAPAAPVGRRHGDRDQAISHDLLSGGRGGHNRLLFVRDKSNVAVDLADSVEIVRRRR